MEWFLEYNSAFMITLATLGFASIGLCIRSCLRSKCSRTELCFGCLVINRDTQEEGHVEIERMNHIPPPTNESENEIV